jgi:hypothetical protein
MPAGLARAPRRLDRRHGGTALRGMYLRPGRRQFVRHPREGVHGQPLHPGSCDIDLVLGRGEQMQRPSRRLRARQQDRRGALLRTGYMPAERRWSPWSDHNRSPRSILLPDRPLTARKRSVAKTIDALPSRAFRVLCARFIGPKAARPFAVAHVFAGANYTGRPADDRI